MVKLGEAGFVAMFVWALVLVGPTVLPLALLLRPDLPQPAAEALLILGVLTLFLAICATEVVGDGSRRAKRGVGAD